MIEQFDAVIIGAGPAGMMAAGRAAERDRRVLLLERNDTVGRKLLISGGGRCNLTHSGELEDFLEQFSESGAFLRNAFARFFNRELVLFFEDARLKLKTEPDGRLFPQSGKADDILNILKVKLNHRNIQVILGERAQEIIICDGKDRKITGVLTNSGRCFLTSRVAIATGGLSYPQTGSTGDGYAMARKLGHKIVPLKPALVPVCIRERFIRDWQGIALKEARLTLFSGGKKIEERAGEMLLTHFGLSGPVVLDLSAAVYDALQIKDEVNIAVNFQPGLEDRGLEAQLLSEFKAAPRKSLKNILKHFLPQGIIRQFLTYCNINADKNAGQITSGERKRLIEGLSGLRLTVKDVFPIEEGMVTRGGVDTREINPRTMESRLIKGLFFAGEVLDIAAATGGYNMQAAFSTGWGCGDNL